MKHLLSTLICAALLAACSGSGDTKEQAAEQKVATPAAASEESNTETTAGNDAKADIEAIAQALEDAGMEDAAGKDAEWKQRLAAARSDADVKAVLNEQLEIYSQALQAFSGVQLTTEEGKNVRQQLLSGFAGMSSALGTLKTVDLDSPQGQVLMKESVPGMQRSATFIAEGMQLYMDMLKNNGYDVNPEDEAEFQEEMQEVQKKDGR